MNENFLGDIERFYNLIAKLEDGIGGKRLFKECDGYQIWPKRGVYLIFENGEYRFDTTNDLRITRIGTHAIKENEETTLWDRLRNHRGTCDGGGNHRGSIFRRHVGSALINRSNGEFSYPSWARKNHTKEERCFEKSLERFVTEYIGECSLLWLSIEDVPSPMSDRAYVEKQIIGLLSNASNLDHPSKDWLGNFSPRPEIRSSGLWNVDHVGHTYNPKFLDKLESIVTTTITYHR